MRISFLALLLLASSALLLGACVGPDSWNEDPWQRAKTQNDDGYFAASWSSVNFFPVSLTNLSSDKSPLR